MIHTGLVSVTFRPLSPQAIIDLVAGAGLVGIEWGGDVHVPHGDVGCARQVQRWTADAGLEVVSYGSYYRVGHAEPVPFEAVVETALALGAPVVRVWAGKRGSAQADDAYRRRVVQDSVRIAEQAQAAGLTVAYEYHGNTLTDASDSALQLLREVDHGAMRTYWQPGAESEEAASMGGLRAVLPWLVHVHVNQGRRPLSEGADVWRRWLDVVQSTGREHYALIEFVQDDAPEAFARDAATLRGWVE
jgi:sugar phosphate isomerase/epimerase